MLVIQTILESSQMKFIISLVQIILDKHARDSVLHDNGQIYLGYSGKHKKRSCRKIVSFCLSKNRKSTTRRKGKREKITIYLYNMDIFIMARYVLPEE